MARVQTLTIETRGEWSPVQARAILDAILEEAETLGLRFKAIDITSHGGPSRVLLLPFCARHDKVVPENGACSMCLHEPARPTPAGTT